MSTHVDKIKIDCPLKECGYSCKSPDKKHMLFIKYFADGVEIKQETCEPNQNIYLTDGVWNSFRMLLKSDSDESKIKL